MGIKSSKSITFGALASQLKTQLGFDNKEIGHYQKDADAVSRLLARGVLTETEGHKCRYRICQKINKMLEAL